VEGADSGHKTTFGLRSRVEHTRMTVRFCLLLFGDFGRVSGGVSACASM